jgi:hypothetical protein
MRQADRFHLSLQTGDTENETVGCRHTNPDACAKHSLAGICAFVRGDGICREPAKSWPRQYRKLKGNGA